MATVADMAVVAAVVDPGVADTGGIKSQEIAACRAAGPVASGFCFVLTTACLAVRGSGRIFLCEGGATVEIAAAISDAPTRNKYVLPTQRGQFLDTRWRGLWGMGKTADGILAACQDVQGLRFAGVSFGKRGRRFFGPFRAPGRLIHSSTPNDYDYGLLSIF
jgi:hypothetical protein